MRSPHKMKNVKMRGKTCVNVLF